MLKALEVAGFKSFADRTRFDFPEGITVVVGPNGSGKSNIVDAMKWVLGSQSAKSLRGKEMADVIFKGSQQRGPAGSAEATIVFDNSSGALDVDSEEVTVTRRVFRSGEGEYLINGSPCRLKDVKDLIRGTGIGIDAYSLIEQGKVDRMLQANAKDRRAIFEEAAGISRFKAKKVEAERRLGRVQQNLTRLGDIVDEVGGRLQSLKSQASRAEKYRTTSTRMQDLRTQLAWTDWSGFDEQFARAEQLRDASDQAAQKHQAERDALQLQRRQMDEDLQDAATHLQAVEKIAAQRGRNIAVLSGRVDANQETLQRLLESIQNHRHRTRSLISQNAAANSELQTLRQQVADYTGQLKTHVEAARLADQAQESASQAARTATQARDEVQHQHLAAVRAAADLDAALQRLQQQIDASTRSGDTLRARQHACESAVAEVTGIVAEAQRRLKSLDERIDSRRRELDHHASSLDEQRRVIRRRDDEVSALQIRLQRIIERQNVLSELQQRQEGMTLGVRSLMHQVNIASQTSPNTSNQQSSADASPPPT
ncbi:MAG: AAA family ATPase, partial [Planctomycetota bacterium]